MKGIDVDAVLASGGKIRLDFLSFCVVSVRVEPLFGFLVEEFRRRPTNEGAIALYDCFCAPRAPARLQQPTELLPPRNPRFTAEIERIRGAHEAAAAARKAVPELDEEDSPPVPPPIPPRHVFDTLYSALASGPGDPLRAPGRDFDPNLSPRENLPGGRMTVGQRAFVDNVWQPRVRPTLTAAGYWRIANVG